MRDDLKDLQKAVQQFQVGQRRPRSVDWLILLARLTRMATALAALILVGVAVSILRPHMGRIRSAADRLLHPATAASASQPTADFSGADASLPPALPRPSPIAPATVAAPARPTESVAVHRIADVFIVGAWEYSVSAVAWQDLYKPAIDKTVWPSPGHKFLVIRLTICNIGQEAALPPPPRLLGHDGVQFDVRFTTGDGPAVDDPLAPDRHYKRQIVFDVPPDKSYKLVLSGGWLSDRQAIVEMGR
jgi:hypothetical protein